MIVKVQDTHYDDNSGNPFYQIEFMVENNSSVDVRIGGGNACVVDFQVPDNEATIHIVNNFVTVFFFMFISSMVF